MGKTVSQIATDVYSDADDAIRVKVVSGGSSGAQYTEGDTDASITGTAVMWEDAGDTLKAASAANPLPVNVVAGATSGTEYTEGDVDASITGGAVLAESPSDTLAPLQLDASLNLKTAVQSSALPTGAATSAKQDSQTALLTTIDADTSTIAGAVSGSEMQVDVVTSALPTGAATSAKQDTIIGHVDGIEGLLTTIDADTSTLAGAVSGTEMQVDVVTSALPTGASTSAKQDTIIGHIDGVETALGTLALESTQAPQSTFDHGARSSIGTTAVQITASSLVAKKGVLVKSTATNTVRLYIGNSDVTNGTTDATDGFELDPGESEFIEVDNANKVYVIAASGTTSRVSFKVV